MESLSPVLGVMKFETEPLSFENWNMLKWLGISWLQNAGGFAMIGLFLWVLHGLVNPQYETLPNGKRRNRLINPFMVLMGLVALTLYLVTLGLNMILSSKTETQIAEARIDHFMWGRMIGNLELAFEFALAAAGLAAIIGFAGPFFRDLFRMRWGRIYAIAKLSFKEAVRKRVVWVFLGFLALYLFPARWFFQEKPEDELKNIIDVTTRGMNLLLIFVGLLLTAFSIPTDIKNLTIHTIVTKPVERFEIVLGRFFGFLGLITAALLMMTGFGLVLINLGNISPEAEKESMKARQAIYGKGLYFRSKKTADFTGIDVGREDGYRRYIAGHPQTSQRAIWAFTDVPSSFESMPFVPLEFAFDVYRTTKGVEGAGVQVSFELVTHNWDPTKKVPDPEGKGLEPTAIEAFEQETKDLRNVRPSDPNWKKVDEIAAKYGRYVVNNWQIFDYHTSTIPVPTGLFKNAASGTPVVQAPNAPPIRLQVLAKCETPSQFIGVAKYDLYFLKSDGNFSWNYVKGSIGLWLRLVIATALAVTCSTYLAGVLSFLIALFIFMGGFFLEFITEVSRGLNVGGGPFVSMTRLLKNTTSTVELDQTPTVRVLQLLDGVYQWVLRRVMDIIPDVERYGLSDYVAQGFDIGPGFLFINFLMVVAYVLPWLVAAYYLMKAREVAA